MAQHGDPGSINRDNLIELRRDRERLRRLFEIAVDAGAPIEARIQNMLKAGTRMFDLEIGLVCAVEGQRCTVVHVHAPGFDFQAGQSSRLGDTYCDIPHTAEDVVAISQMKKSPYSGHPSYTAYKFEAYIGMPLKVRGRNCGTLSFFSPNPSLRPFSDTDLDLMRLMGRWVCDVLEKKEIEAELQSHRQNLEDLVAQRTHALNQKIEEAAEAEKALKNNLAVMDAFIDTIPAPVFFKDAEGRYQGCNAAFADAVLGLDKEAIIGHTLFELNTVIPSDLARIYHQRDLEILKMADTQVYEAPVKCADSEIRHYLFSKASYTDDQGRISGLVGIMMDITRRKHSEAELARLTSILEATNDLVSTATPDGRITYMNRAGQQMLGWENGEQSERKISDGHPPWAYEILKNTGMPDAIEKGVWSGETALLGADGSEIAVSQVIMAHKDSNGRLLYLSTIIRDISDIKHAQQERMDLETRLRQSQKMESIGTLAGGIAHDFNNILAAILGFTEITYLELPEESTHRQNLQKVLKAGQRARDLVNQILTFSRQTEQEIKPIRVKPIVSETLKLLRATLPATIVIEADIMSTAMVMADPIQIHQAVMNLCTNAAHAMQAEGGCLSVKLFDTSLDEQACGRHHGLQPGNYLVLQVADTGHGMNTELRERIFDPFFTTKRKGEGTGLGLSVVHGIITGSGGAIDVESAPGRGTTFSIYLPPIEDDGREIAPQEISLPTGTESILLVDDEEFQADLGQLMLQNLGYRVHSVTNSKEALELFLKSPGAYDLVITDMTMPHMTGDVLAGYIKEHRPGLPVIICTGFSNRMDENTARKAGIAALLHKPILMEELATAVRKALDGLQDEQGKA